MTHDDDFIAQLEDYLVAFDGVTPLPDRVRDEVRAELPSARQARPRPGLERVFTMLSPASAGARIGVAAAAVVVAVVLGAGLLNNNRSSVVTGVPPTAGPTATAAPSLPATVAPTAVPSVAASPPMLVDATYVACTPADSGKSCIAPGTYQLSGAPGDWPVTVTMDVPLGWFGWEANEGFDGVLVTDGPPTFAGSGWGVMFAGVGDVARDPCDGTKGMIPAAQVNTPQKVAAAIASWPGFTVTTPLPITVDGHSGVRFVATYAGRTACKVTNASGWVTRRGAGIDLYPMIGQPATAPGTFEIVDTGNGLLAIRSTDFPQTSPAELEGLVPMNPTAHAAQQPALHAIINSIRFTPAPSS
jgi:hypothetical protein